MDENIKNDKLFGDFPPVSTGAWEEKIKTDLKGADYEKKLIWKTDEGFSVKPYYRADDLSGLEYLDVNPGEFPFVRGDEKKDNRWIVRQDISHEDPAEANVAAVDAIHKGAESVGFRTAGISAHKDMTILLRDIDPAATQINFTSSRSYPLTMELFTYEVASKGTSVKDVKGSLNFDPLGYLLLHGDFYKSDKSNFDEAAYLIEAASKNLPEFRIININGQIFSGAGSTLVQELAFTLSSANEYLFNLTERGISIDKAAKRMQLTFGTGSNYFMEIAKLRAARLLWAKLVEQYHPQDPESMKVFIHTVTSEWNKTVFDPFVNMLRTTTEGMSAVIGNSDSLTILPFDRTFRKESEFSDRIARNQQLILREEAYLDKVSDPSSGSYYIENLTNSIASHAWELFKIIEEKQGFIECVKTGFIQDEIQKSADKKNMDVAQRKIVMIGTNQYPNLNETMLNEISKDIFAEKTEGESTYKKLKIYRGTAEFEKLRLDTEKRVKDGKKRPSVFLFTIGNLAMRKARATFATNFFGTAGFSVIDNPGFCSVEDGVKAALESKADFVVICSSDEEYVTVGPAASQGIKAVNPDVKVIVAGYPKEIMEMLKSSGVDDFIHVRSNVIESLKKYQSELN